MSDADWIERLAVQYGAKQMAALRGDETIFKAADMWLASIAEHHWHEIIEACRIMREARRNKETNSSRQSAILGNGGDSSLDAKPPAYRYTNRCPHEWYQGRCIHCDIKAVDGRPEQPDKVPVISVADDCGGPARVIEGIGRKL